ncbi:MAG: quinolinate synthase NadA [Candidatus Altiarchaeales archaeon]|nr:quinolinate synthase NadA [Candidatus Altiarchaeales archaeon]
MSLQQEVEALKKDKNAVILAHNYQRPEVQDIADFVGDSYGLSVKAKETSADIIVFCGVDFMAETAAILNPDKKVLMPSMEALCPMAMLLGVDELRSIQNSNPAADTVLYVNTHARAKAYADCICTSSNAVEVVSAMDSDSVIFGPDINLAHYVGKRVSKKIISAPKHGFCPTHHLIEPQDVEDARKKHPNAVLAVHPECQPGVQDMADYIGSTAGIIDYTQKSDACEFIIGTENGIIHRLKKLSVDKKFYPACDMTVCPTMKTVTLEKVRDSLWDEKDAVEVPGGVAEKARAAIERMIDIVGKS